MLKKFKNFSNEVQKDDYNGFVCYSWSDRIIKRNKQIFAIFGSVAYDVTKMKFTLSDCNPGCGKLCVPIEGRYLGEFPDEGQSGILGCYIVPNKGDKGKNRLSDPCFVHCGWLHTQELNLTNEEIKQNIIEDVIEGKNVFTKKPAGWI